MLDARGALWEGGQQREAFREGGTRFVIGIAPGGSVSRLLEIVHGSLHLAAALEVERELGGDLARLGAIAFLQPCPNAPVELDAPHRAQALIQHLAVERMLKAVAPTAGAIRPHRPPGIVEEVTLRRHRLTLRFDRLHGALDPGRHRRHCKLLAHHTGGL